MPLPKIPFTYVEIDLTALRHNLKELRRLSIKQKFSLPTRPRELKKSPPPHQILAVIKADAYGHGMVRVAQVLDKEGVDFFAVSDVSQGINLRKEKITKPILLFETTLPLFIKEIVDYRLIPSVCTMELAKALEAEAKKRKTKIDIHIKVDTGMGRLGVWHEEAESFIKKISQFSHLRSMGIFTHFPSADVDRPFTREQIDALYNLVTALDRQGLIIPYIHAANSMGLAGYQTHVLNVSRPGLMLYGLYPDSHLRKDISLKPVMSVKSHIIFIKDVPAGRSISYGRTFFTKKTMRVATIPVGYHDGYFRAFSNASDVLIAGKRCRILGRVTMDQIIVDVTNITAAKMGSEVVILGRQGKEEISADELAELANTINYEIACSLGNRLPRIYKN